jgi:pilus assembly protein Flp/PilA
VRRIQQVLLGTGGFFRSLRHEELGATATEYSVMVGFIALAIVAGVGAFGLALNGVFTDFVTAIGTALGIP